MIKITPDELRVIADYIHAESGIILDQTKAYLIESRLASLLAELGVANYGELYVKAQNDKTGRLANQIVEAMTTNETSFFRDQTPFDLITHKLIPELLGHSEAASSKKSSPPIHIWSAACSTGQEVYSLIIALNELLGDLSRTQIQILATDISEEALCRASSGVYHSFEVERGLSPDIIHKYFTQEGNRFRIREEYRSPIIFKKLNLLTPFIGLPSFDIILCRNVAIYFTNENRKILFKKMADRLLPQGSLIIGSTESLRGICDSFVRKEFRTAVYYELKANSGTE